jgi:ring-1,2-phenylacetyl-CoA epoxidase subunit PaaE
MLGRDQLTHKLKVKSKRQETSDTYSFALDIPDKLKSKFKYKAGQFVTIFYDLKGEEIRRSYSLSSSPNVDQDFIFTVKKVPGGKLSPILCDSIKEADELFITPPAGRFTLPDPLNNNELVFFAAGSGITPIFSLIKSALSLSNTVCCILLYSCRDEDSLIFDSQLKKLLAAHPNRFKMEYVLSAPKSAWDGKQGRISTTMLEDFLNSHSIPKNTITFLCGPDGFMKNCQSTLELHGFAADSIKFESFSAVMDRNDFADELGTDVTYVGDKNLLARPDAVEIELGGDTIHLTPKEGVSILEALLEEGHNPPYSCMNGSCMACLGKVREGLIYQNDMGILTDDNIKAKECLTCQAHPASKKVKISYDF